MLCAVTEPVSTLADDAVLSRGNAFRLAVWREAHGPWMSVLAVLVTFCFLTGTMFVAPPQSPPSKTDVVFVIGPPDQWRIRWAEQLVDSRLAGTIMISISDDLAAKEPLCLAGSYHSVPVLCHRPAPFTTQGEARWLQAEMASHRWMTATVITVTPHVFRTRLYFDRCIPEGVNVVGRPTGLNQSGWLHQFAYQTGGLVKAFTVTTSC